MDLSDNQVRVEQVRNLKALLELNLSSNKIRDVPIFSQGDFMNLEVLNLAYN